MRASTPGRSGVSGSLPSSELPVRRTVDTAAQGRTRDEVHVDHDEDDDLFDDDDEYEPPRLARPATPPLLPRAQKLLARWETSGKMELEEDCDRQALAEALLEKRVTLEGHRHLGAHLSEWLIERPEVADVFASDDELEEDVRKP